MSIPLLLLHKSKKGQGLVNEGMHLKEIRQEMSKTNLERCSKREKRKLQ